MSSDGSRRFTDREVALVLRKAAEIEESGATASRGLSLQDLEEIGREVGISPEAIAKAAAGLDRRRERTPMLGAGPLVHRALHAVDGELSEEAMGRLVRLIDERTDSTGAVTEALGTVRWTGGDRFHSTQVSITPEDGETTIQVVEKAVPRLRRIFHLVPAGWGAIRAGPAVGSIDPVAGTAAVGILGLGAVVGALAGRTVWGVLSARSGARVERLAADPSREARAANKKGLQRSET